MTRLEKWKTATPWEMQALLKSYEDTGLTPEEVSFIRAENKRLRDRLVVSPYGDDKIDELEGAIEFLRHKVDTFRAQLTDTQAQLSEAVGALGAVDDAIYRYKVPILDKSALSGVNIFV
ncbi:MAG: hypothetical protein M0P69_20005, partial [Bacteroidales bacterium]|nr:hypothetical protein [Bacteroidales bacterium]